jgi:hypothetical protein
VSVILIAFIHAYGMGMPRVDANERKSNLRSSCHSQLAIAPVSNPMRSACARLRSSAGEHAGVGVDLLLEQYLANFVDQANRIFLFRDIRPNKLLYSPSDSSDCAKA